MIQSRFQFIGLLIIMAIILTGCAQMGDDLRDFFGKSTDDAAPIPPPPEPTWEPDKSHPFTVAGSLTDGSTGQPIKDVDVVATYIIDCPTSECVPFKESIQTTSNEKGEYTLDLYRNFWTITYSKTQFQTMSQKITLEETTNSTSKLVDITLKIGVLKDSQGYVRDQGKRIIFDRGGAGGYSVNFDGKAKYFEYLIVMNAKESSIYKELLSVKNQQVQFKGYIFQTTAGQGEINLVSFSTY